MDLNLDDASLKQNGFQIVKSFLELDFVEFIQDYFSLKINSNKFDLKDNQVPFSYEFYGDTITETILQNCCEPLSKVVGIKLLPTYSFTRLYNKGDELKIHRDRSECEISATISLGYSDEESAPPLFFSKTKENNNPTKVVLEPGDLCFYRGCDLWHWRPPIKNKWVLQTFLHFVDAEGDNSDLIYDSRSYLGIHKQ